MGRVDDVVHQYISQVTMSNDSEPTRPPFIAVFTFLLNCSRDRVRSAAASAYINSYRQEPVEKNFTFVEWIRWVWLDEEKLKTNHDRIEVQNRFPVFSQDVETDVAFEINIRMIYLLRALDFGRIVRIVVVYRESEVEGAIAIHACLT